MNPGDLENSGAVAVHPGRGQSEEGQTHRDRLCGQADSQSIPQKNRQGAIKQLPLGQRYRLHIVKGRYEKCVFH